MMPGGPLPTLVPVRSAHGNAMCDVRRTPLIVLSCNVIGKVPVDAAHHAGEGPEAAGHGTCSPRSKTTYYPACGVLLDQVELPVHALDLQIHQPNPPGNIVCSRAQFGNRKRCDVDQLRP